MPAISPNIITIHIIIKHIFLIFNLAGFSSDGEVRALSTRLALDFSEYTALSACDMTNTSSLAGFILSSSKFNFNVEVLFAGILSCDEAENAKFL